LWDNRGFLDSLYGHNSPMPEYLMKELLTDFPGDSNNFYKISLGDYDPKHFKFELEKQKIHDPKTGKCKLMIIGNPTKKKKMI
jgi:hypothetical protein